MAKDVNIHVKTQGTQQSASELNEVGQAAEEMGAKSSRAAGWIKEAFTALVGPLGVSAVVGLAVSGFRYYIAALEDMKNASANAVHELADRQRAAKDFFETMDAYSSKDRKAALNQVFDVQKKYGLQYEASKQLLTSQQRTFGEINPQSTEQFAAYWQFHGPSTADLIRWMGESGIKTPEQQGQIMRMISAVSKQKSLSDEELITALTSQGEKFRYLGWSPEQTIENLGKILVPGEGTRGIMRLFTAMESFTPDKAREMHALPAVANDERARWEFLQTKAAKMSPQKRNEFLAQTFGMSAPAINRLLFEPTSPELQRAIDYAVSPQAAAEAKQHLEEYKKTTEGEQETGAGVAGQIKANLPNTETLKTTVRDIGKAYLEKLKYEDRATYEKIYWTNFGENRMAEAAAAHLWFQTISEAEKQLYVQMAGKDIGWGHYEKFPEQAAREYGFEKMTPEQQLANVKSAQAALEMSTEQAPRKTNDRAEMASETDSTINHVTNVHNNDFHVEHNMNYYPVAGSAADRDIGPRAGRDFK